MKMLLIAAWVICGVVAGGFSFSFAQRRFVYISRMTIASDYFIALIISLCGPLGLLSFYLSARALTVRPWQYPCSWRRLSDTERSELMERVPEC